MAPRIPHITVPYLEISSYMHTPPGYIGGMA